VPQELTVKVVEQSVPTRSQYSQNLAHSEVRPAEVLEDESAVHQVEGGVVEGEGKDATRACPDDLRLRRLWWL